MKTYHKTTVLAVAALLATGLFANAQPGPDRPEPGNGPNRRMERPGIQPGGPGGMQGAPGAPVLEQALTEDQRDSMRQAMMAQREKMRELQEKMRDARQALMKAALAEEFKESAVQAKALEVAKIEAEINVIRLKALAEVQPPLTEEQLERLLNPQPLPGLRPGADGDGRPNRQINRPDRGPRPAGQPPRPKPDND